MKQCRHCKKKVDFLYSGYCLSCFQVIKMEKDKNIDESDKYMEIEKGSTPINELFMRSAESSKKAIKNIYGKW